MALAAAFLIAAWQASADSCGVGASVSCRSASTVTSISRSVLVLDAAAKSDDAIPFGRDAGSALRDTAFSQSGSLLLLGVGLALAARTLKRQKPLA